MNLDLVFRGYWTLAVWKINTKIRYLFRMYSQNANCEQLI